MPKNFFSEVKVLCACVLFAFVTIISSNTWKCTVHDGQLLQWGVVHPPSYLTTVAVEGALSPSPKCLVLMLPGGGGGGLTPLRGIKE